MRVRAVISPSHSLLGESLLIGTLVGSLTFVRLFCDHLRGAWSPAAAAWIIIAPVTIPHTTQQPTPAQPTLCSRLTKWKCCHVTTQISRHCRCVYHIPCRNNHWRRHSSDDSDWPVREREQQVKIALPSPYSWIGRRQCHLSTCGANNCFHIWKPNLVFQL